MVNFTKKILINFTSFIPIFLLFFIALNGNSVVNIKMLPINIHYILVYFWILRKPESMRYSLIFLSGIITDVVYGLPLGITALSLLAIGGVAAYVRILTVRITLINDWISFVPAIVLANFIYFLSLYFSNLSVDYLYLIKISVVTFIAYPILWVIFSIFINFSKG